MRQKNFFYATALLTLFILAGCTTAAWAHGGAVIPLWRTPKPLQNIVTVAKSGGDFTDPVAAVASITDASETNPYLVYIAPGIYPLTQTLVMKPFVDLRGSGQTATTLSGSISTADIFTSAIVKLANSSVLASLTVFNEGGGAFSVAIASDSPPGSVVDHPFVKGVTILADGATNNIGAAFKTAKVSIEDSDIFTVGGNTTVGIWAVENSELLIKDTVIAAEKGSTGNNAVSIEASDVSLDSVSAKAADGINNAALAVENAGGTLNKIMVKDSSLVAGGEVGEEQNSAIYIDGLIYMQLLRVEAQAKPASGGASQSIGVKANSIQELFIMSSDISGATKSLEMDGQSVLVNKSTLIGAVSIVATNPATVLHSLVGGNVSTAGTALELFHVDQQGTNTGSGNFSAANSVLSVVPTRTTGTITCANSSLVFAPLNSTCTTP